MIFTKYPSPANFSFISERNDANGELKIGTRTVSAQLKSYEGGIHQIRLVNPQIWEENPCLVDPLFPAEAQLGLTWGESHELQIPGVNGESLVSTVPGAGIGLNALASVFQFALPAGCNFFGMGQKNFATLELSGKRTVNWNTDVWSDFHWAQWKGHPADPSYFTTPYIAVELPKGGWVGFLLQNPSPTFMSTPGKETGRAFVHWQETSPHLVLGSYDGEPHLIIITAPSLKELTRKLQKLVGVTPTPPLWSLGYHQSRWGYGGHDDLMELDQNFTSHKIPCSGLWLDLDYMVGYRIFMTDQALFPKGVKYTADALAKSGRRVVPIIDPGVKHEKGYKVYDDGHAQGMFCINREGQEYIGMVWPGHTVFPDFTQPRVRDWWGSYAEEFRSSGFGGCWVDMNDPSTGPIDPYDMLFKNGRSKHWEHRNQYALGMQMATHAGFLRSQPNERPFILSRSGFTGSSRYCAIWTGDNVANDFYLKLSVTCSLGMGLSGHAFTGSDVGGFGDDTSGELLERWMQANFLFPFCRNHTTAKTRRQEPYSYPQKQCDNIAHYIRLRYKFLPHLYQLFAEHEETGDPILRPLFYEFTGKKLVGINDQFLVGASILQAPILEAQGTKRSVLLPGKEDWLDLTTGKWMKPGNHPLACRRTETPLFLRTGALVATQPGLPETSAIDLTQPEVLVAIPKTWSGQTQTTLVADDGLTLDYQKGKRTKLRVTLVAAKGSLTITTEEIEGGFKAIKPTFVFFHEPSGLTINGKKAKITASTQVFSGKALKVWKAN